MHAFRAVETAAYCPRKLYYRRRQPRGQRDETPEIVKKRRQLAFEYDTLLSDKAKLRAAPIEVTPTQFHSRMGCARARVTDWEGIVDPAEREVVLSGRDCRGVAHKILAGSPPAPSLVFAGEPPQQGVWTPQSVRLVAAAKALSWERETSVERAIAEYPAYGVVREIDIDARRTAAYREAVRTADAIDGPPARTKQREKCSPCDYRDQCGVRTRSLRSLLGG